MEWIYGINPVFEAIRAGRSIKKIFISSGRHEKIQQIRAEADRRRIPVEVVGSVFFDNNLPKGHQGIAARVSQKGYTSLDDLLAIPLKLNEAPLFVILDCIEDPRNLGAILRTADAAGVHGVVIQAYRAAGISPEVSKASAGAIEYVPVCMVPNIKNAIKEMKEAGIAVVGAEIGDYPVTWKADISGPLAVVIGSEGKGIRRTVKESCDSMVTLPMKGKINSLNASVAAGIFLFEILRQRAIKSEG
jgi:23S rRNA (guanosine2251-2'-O)-methyltransferase